MATTELSRAQLIQEFRDGERPSGNDFASAWSSFLHKSDDGVKVDSNGNLELNRGIAVKNTPDNSQAGTLRFNSGQLQYHDGTSFKSINTGTSGVFVPVVAGSTGVAYGSGNVGIGAFVAAPTHRLDVILGNNVAGTTDQQVKMGNLVVHNGATGDAAYINNAAKTGDLNYALRQNSQGETTINTSNNTQLVLAQNGSVRFRVLVSGAIELAPVTSITLNGDTVVGNPIVNKNLTVFGNVALGVNGGPARTLTVFGEAFKMGSANWLPAVSDARVKKDVVPFENGLKKLIALQPVSFKYNGKAETPDDGKDYEGFIAQDLQKIFPDLIIKRRLKLEKDDTEETDILTYDQGPLFFVMINAIKEISTRLDKLEKNTLNDKLKQKNTVRTDN